MILGRLRSTRPSVESRAATQEAAARLLQPGLPDAPEEEPRGAQTQITRSLPVTPFCSLSLYPFPIFLFLILFSFDGCATHCQGSGRAQTPAYCDHRFGPLYGSCPVTESRSPRFPKPTRMR